MRAACVWAALTLAPLAALTWEASAAAVPYMAASAALHTVYFLGLGRAYRTSDVDVYAVARGTGPVLVLIVAAEGVERADPTAFLAVALAPMALVCLALLRRDRAVAELRERHALAVGIGMIAAYLLVLWALQRAPAAPVAALRETSILLVAFAAGLGGRYRIAAAALVFGGVVLVVAG
jgi:drug/metabolite transporter (DMT)-like permease